MVVAQIVIQPVSQPQKPRAYHYVVPQGVKDFWELFDAKGLEAVTDQLSKRTDPNALALFDHVLDIDLSPPTIGRYASRIFNGGDRWPIILW